MLLEHGFTEATQNPFHFWKILTEKTAFVINIKDLPQGKGIVYGVISTAVFWSDGDWDYFKKRGRSDDDINLRFYLEIHTENDAVTAGDTIGALYQEYLHINKDTMLANVKELR